MFFPYTLLGIQRKKVKLQYTRNELLLFATKVLSTAQ